MRSPAKAERSILRAVISFREHSTSGGEYIIPLKNERFTGYSKTGDQKENSGHSTRIYDKSPPKNQGGRERAYSDLRGSGNKAEQRVWRGQNRYRKESLWRNRCGKSIPGLFYKYRKNRSKEKIESKKSKALLYAEKIRKIRTAQRNIC